MIVLRGAGLAAALVLGCGARGGLEVRALDASVAVPDARETRDAPDVPTACPAPSAFGYTVVPREPVPVPVAPGEISLAGDGERVALAVSARPTGDVGAIIELDAQLRVLALRVEPIQLGRTSVEGGVVRVASLASDGQLVLSTSPRRGVVDTAVTTIFRGPLALLARPAWNGERVVIAGSTGFELFLGAFVPDATSTAWRSFGPAEDVDVAAQPGTGITELVYRSASGVLHVETFGADGSPLDDRPLEDVGFEGRVALGWLDADGTGQPIVLAGVALGESGLRAQLRRFRLDGSAAGGFSAPIDSMPGGVDLTTVAPPGHRHGYGMVAGSVGGTALFHGAGEDFVGDARPLPIACDGDHVSIAPSRCGYAIACTSGEEVHLALAIAPRAR
jgi:hypothetical protein